MKRLTLVPFKHDKEQRKGKHAHHRTCHDRGGLGREGPCHRPEAIRNVVQVRGILVPAWPLRSAPTTRVHENGAYMIHRPPSGLQNVPTVVNHDDVLRGKLLTIAGNIVVLATIVPPAHHLFMLARKARFVPEFAVPARPTLAPPFRGPVVREHYR